MWGCMGCGNGLGASPGDLVSRRAKGFGGGGRRPHGAPVWLMEKLDICGMSAKK